MSKKKWLDDVQIIVFFYIWANGSLTCTRQELGQKLCLTEGLVTSALHKLNCKRWIRKNKGGKGIILEPIKKDIPKYVLIKAEKYLEKLAS